MPKLARMSNQAVDLSPAEAAEYMGVHDATIRRWISKGILPAERVGPRLIRIKRTDLDALSQPIGGVVA